VLVSSVTTDYRVAQVRVIFSLTESIIKQWFPTGTIPPKYLAYVEWFTPFAREPDGYHGLYKVSCSHHSAEQRLATIIPVSNIHCSIHLLPKFGPVAPREWTSSTVLDNCPNFLVNSMADRHIFNIFHSLTNNRS
jgi:hypothetical protein